MTTTVRKNKFSKRHYEVLAKALAEGTWQHFRNALEDTTFSMADLGRVMGECHNCVFDAIADAMRRDNARFSQKQFEECYLAELRKRRATE